MDAAGAQDHILVTRSATDATVFLPTVRQPDNYTHAPEQFASHPVEGLQNIRATTLTKTYNTIHPPFGAKSEGQRQRRALPRSH